MQKRGQVAIFIIVGIVLISALVLVFFFRDSLREGFKNIVNKEEYANSQFNEIQTMIEKCIDKETVKKVNLLGEQGGYFNPLNYDNYYGKKVTILCDNVAGKDYCLAKPLDLEDVNLRLNKELKFSVKNCINLEPYTGKNYLLNTGTFDLQSEINPDNVLVTVNYPVKIKYDEVEVKKDTFIKKVKVPLGNAVILTNTILNSEATNGEFDALVAGFISKGIFTVEKRKSYPNKIYILDFGNGKYKFNFAIEGEA